MKVIILSIFLVLSTGCLTTDSVGLVSGGLTNTDPDITTGSRCERVTVGVIVLIPSIVLDVISSPVQMILYGKSSADGGWGWTFTDQFMSSYR